LTQNGQAWNWYSARLAVAAFDVGLRLGAALELARAADPVDEHDELAQADTKGFEQHRF
jgi:hypothetical protein